MSISAKLAACALLTLSLGLSALTSASPASAGTKPTAPTCGGFEKKCRVGSEFVQVNPGSKCRYYRFRFEVARVGGSVPKACFLVKVAGGDKQYGPFCSGGSNLGMPVPKPIEWINSTVPMN